MAKENIAKFDAVKTNKTLTEKLAALAVEHGYDFTADDLLELGSARPLSDEEVAGAAGGGLNPPKWGIPPKPGKHTV